MTTIITRELGVNPKPTPLTNEEMDQNFINLNEDKAEIDGSNASGTWPINITGTAALESTGVTAGTYGSSTNIPQINVDEKGRITEVVNTPVSIATLSFGSTPPSSPTNGDKWINSNDGIEYEYLQDGDSGQWVELGPSVGGPQGEPGPQGIQGIQGEPGPASAPIYGEISYFQKQIQSGYIPANGTPVLKADYPNLTGVLADYEGYTLRTLPASANWVSVAWNGSIFCAIAASSNIAATSPDGITWTQQTLPANTNWYSIVWNGSIFCAIAASTTVAATSPDGITWTLRTLPVNASWYSMAWNGSVFCAVGYGSNIAITSPDGITWTQQTLPATANWYGMAWNGSIFCAIATNSNIAATSPDGITWTQQTLPANITWRSIAWNGSVFCAIANTYIAATSPDGITWTQQTLPISGNWISISTKGSKFYAYCSNQPFFATSDDNGITWVSRYTALGTTYASVSNEITSVRLIYGTTTATTSNAVDTTRFEIPFVTPIGGYPMLRAE